MTSLALGLFYLAWVVAPNQPDDVHSPLDWNLDCSNGRCHACDLPPATETAWSLPGRETMEVISRGYFYAGRCRRTGELVALLCAGDAHWGFRSLSRPPLPASETPAHLGMNEPWPNVLQPECATMVLNCARREDRLYARWADDGHILVLGAFSGGRRTSFWYRWDEWDGAVRRLE